MMVWYARHAPLYWRNFYRHQYEKCINNAEECSHTDKSYHIESYIARGLTEFGQARLVAWTPWTETVEFDSPEALTMFALRWS